MGRELVAWGEAAKSSLPVYSTELVFVSSFCFSCLLVKSGIKFEKGLSLQQGKESFYMNKRLKDK